ncbi:MAG: site-specific integrase [Alicyclobacillus sp.]|nr:site-specific integrase [Alicyclobacillus sp.]
MCKQFGIHVPGPLKPHVPEFMEELKRRHYSAWSATSYLVVMRHLSLWLVEHNWGLADLTSARIEMFVAERRRLGYAKGRSTRGMVGVLTTYLREIGAIPTTAPSEPSTPQCRVVEDFIQYLARERGLATGTLNWYRFVAMRLLGYGHVEWNGDHCTVTIAPERVIQFLQTEAKHRSTGSLHNITIAARSLLRFLFITSRIPKPLEGTVLPTPGWRDTGPLMHIPTDSQVAALLNSCNRHSPAGCRDFAILLIMSRLGLRAGEVAQLSLDDIDWRQGIIRVRGKGNRNDGLPLSPDVGQAIADYCQQYRPKCHSRCVFVHLRAPHGSLSNGAIGGIVSQACKRAGLAPFGAHRLRHRAAVSMRDAGVPLWEIGQVLRHQRVVTTAHYAKPTPDLTSVLTRPWLGGAE